VESGQAFELLVSLKIHREELVASAARQVSSILLKGIQVRFPGDSKQARNGELGGTQDYRTY